MKRLWIITAGLLAAAIVGITLWHLLPAGTPTPSELYLRYEHQPGVRMGFIEDYRFDDSTFADVVTVEALDSAGWQWMEQEFDLQQHVAQGMAHSGQNGEAITFWQCDDGQNIAFCSWSGRALCFEQPRTESELEHIIIYHLEKLKE